MRQNGEGHITVPAPEETVLSAMATMVKGQP